MAAPCWASRSLTSRGSPETSPSVFDPGARLGGDRWSSSVVVLIPVGPGTQAVQGRGFLGLSVGEWEDFVGGSPGILLSSTPGGPGTGQQEGRRPMACPRCLPSPLLCPGSCILQPLWLPCTPACPTWMPCTAPSTGSLLGTASHPALLKVPTAPTPCLLRPSLFSAPPFFPAPT